MREDIRRRGEKLREYSFKHLNDLAEDYLFDHVDEILDQVHDRQAKIEREVRAAEGPKSNGNSCAELMHKWSGEMIVAYARVSSDGQTLDAQLAALKAAGAEKVFAEKESGQDRSTPASAGDRGVKGRGCSRAASALEMRITKADARTIDRMPEDQWRENDRPSVKTWEARCRDGEIYGVSARSLRASGTINRLSRSSTDVRNGTPPVRLLAPAQRLPEPKSNPLSSDLSRHHSL
jgi:hypothetical protein